MPHYTLRLENGDTAHLRHRTHAALNYEARRACFDLNMPGQVFRDEDAAGNVFLYPDAEVIRGEPDEGRPTFTYVRKGKPVPNEHEVAEPDSGYWLRFDSTGEQMSMTASKLTRVGAEALKRCRELGTGALITLAANRREVGWVIPVTGPGNARQYQFVRGTRPGSPKD